MTPAIETRGLTKRYRRVTALSDCSITVPEGRISALVGPNGAGKTTLLRLLCGLASPTSGDAAILGGAPRQDPAFLAEIGFLAQEIPLYRRMSAPGSHRHRRAHEPPVAASRSGPAARAERPAGRGRGHVVRRPACPGGPCAHAGQAPAGLLLDEPVAALDPLARRHFLGTLADAVAAGGLTVVLSSHLVADIERICDHLILLASSRVQLCGDIEGLVNEHRVLVGPRKDTTAIERDHTVVHTERTARQTTMLVRLNGPVADPGWEAEDVSLEDMVLGYMGADAAPPNAELTAVGGKR